MSAIRELCQQPSLALPSWDAADFDRGVKVRPGDSG
jgi:hypothetical protein